MNPNDWLRLGRGTDACIIRIDEIASIVRLYGEGDYNTEITLRNGTSIQSAYFPNEVIRKLKLAGSDVTSDEEADNE